ncbi:diphosphomevalonate decarboxylase [Pendulispora albinea]|uniref:diphosphomevalonate decarboxylase n=1 Tax=Pendulispora albinea TaxID=2741071 RepID=A0ABZ2MBQ2_9BACT
MSRISEATAIAHPNIALAKYWGKKPIPGNYPAVPSLSVTLDGMMTRTVVRFDSSLEVDRVVLNGTEAAQSDRAHLRVVELLDRVRALAGDTRRAFVQSANDFPTASGLASSASGFAALALAAVRAIPGLDASLEQVSDLARQSSASAARSLFDGFVELEPERPARSIAPPEHIDLHILVCVVTEEKKSIGSTSGMQTTALLSPYFDSWLSTAPVIFSSMKEALAARDWEALGELSEKSALAMHACAMAGGIVYVRGISLDLFAAVRGLRASGILAYFTADAGPHVKVLVRDGDVARATDVLSKVPGVLRVLDTRPGKGATVIASSPEATT